jgi:hypothetical protein
MSADVMATQAVTQQQERHEDEIKEVHADSALLRDEHSSKRKLQVLSAEKTGCGRFGVL